MKPVMTRAIVLNDGSETNMTDAKERIKDEVSRTGRYHESARFVELVYGEGYATLYTNPAFGSDGRKNQRGKRDSGKRNTGAAEKEEVKYSDRDIDAMPEKERKNYLFNQQQTETGSKIYTSTRT